VATFLGARPEDLAFVSNATQGINCVLRSIRFQPGDELITTNHEYNASKNVLDFAAQRDGARVVVVDVPFAGLTPERAEAVVLEKVTPRTRLALLDWVTSPTALRMPMESLVPRLRERGVETLVDGAHAPGMIPTQLDQLGAAYFAGNLHKWVCAPKGAAVLHVRHDKQAEIRPTSISHGANSVRKDRPRYWLEFDWMGTIDPTPWLCAGESIRYMGSLLPGGWPEVMASNRAKALEAQAVLCRALDIPPPVPQSMLGSMASVPLPLSTHTPPPQRTLVQVDPLQERLYREHRLQLPVMPWPMPPDRVLRVSCQLYNEAEQYHRLAAVLPRLLDPR